MNMVFDKPQPFDFTGCPHGNPKVLVSCLINGDGYSLIEVNGKHAIVGGRPDWAGCFGRWVRDENEASLLDRDKKKAYELMRPVWEHQQRLAEGKELADIISCAQP